MSDVPRDEFDRLHLAWTHPLVTEWAIPTPILDAAPESPYGFPTELFVRRGERSIGRERAPTTARALDALGEGGTVLDVGAGGGATSLPLAERCTHLTAVDAGSEMLAAVAETAARVGVPIDVIEGTWPGIESSVPVADVVVCGHVTYNVHDLGSFVRALDQHARRRVVIELTERHPLSWMNDLWLRFHDLTRPDRPTADDAIALVRSEGYEVSSEDRVDSEDVAGSGFERREDAVALVRRRLCLPADRDDEIGEALGSRLTEHDGLWRAGPRDQRVVTMWWDKP